MTPLNHTAPNQSENWNVGHQAPRRIQVLWPDLPEEKTLISIYKEVVPDSFRDVDGQPDVNAMKLFIYLLCEIGTKAHIIEMRHQDQKHGDYSTLHYPDGGLTVDFQDIHANCGIGVMDVLRSLAILFKRDLVQVVQGDDGHLKVQFGGFVWDLETSAIIDYEPGRVLKAGPGGLLRLDLQPVPHTRTKTSVRRDQ